MNYKTKIEQKANPSSPCNLVTGGIVSMKSDSDEKYEKAMPVHGDLMFHKYLERIQENPGQILRYALNTISHKTSNQLRPFQIRFFFFH